MHAPVSRLELLDRADAAIAAAHRLEQEALDRIAVAYAELRRAEQARALQAGLDPPVAISLLVRQPSRR